MTPRRLGLAALILLAAVPAFAQEPVADAPTAAATDCAPSKGKGVGALLSAARRAGVGQLLANQSLAGGKGAVAGAVLGTALSAADAGGSPGPGLGALPFGFGDSKAATAAAATGAAIEVAKAAAAPKAPACPNR